jgi:hypothetical protein
MPPPGPGPSPRRESNAPLPKMARGLSSRMTEVGGRGLQIDDFSRNINMLIEADDLNEKKQFQDQILDSLKLTKQRCGDITKVFNELLQLGYAGLTDTLQVFAKAVHFAVTQSENADESLSESHLSNRRSLFEDEQGRDILRRIIWCSGHEDSDVSSVASTALATLCGSLSGQFFALMLPFLTRFRLFTKYHLHPSERRRAHRMGCS